MIVLLLVFLVLLSALMAALCLLGFRVGGEEWQREALRVRQDGVGASRELHELTRRAFVAMAEEADRQRQGDS